MKRTVLAAATAAVLALTAPPAFAWNNSTYTGFCQLGTPQPSPASQYHLVPVSGVFQTTSTSAPVVSAAVTCWVVLNGVLTTSYSGGTMTGPAVQYGAALREVALQPGDVIWACWYVDYTDPNDTTPTATTC